MENSKLNSNRENERNATCLLMLPEDCTEKIMAFTSPLDVCRLSLVSKSVESTANSDSVWEKFIPSDYPSIIASSLTPIPDFPSKKDLFVHLCHNPLLIDAGRKSFSLDKRTGKKCYLLSARDLHISWGDTPEHWKWTSLPESRFPEVAKLISVWWLEIRGTIRAGVLSPRTSYAAYLVYKLEDEYGFDYKPSEVSVGVAGIEFDKQFAFVLPGSRECRIRHYRDESDYTLSSDTEDELGQPADYQVSVYTLPSDVEELPELPNVHYEDSVVIPPTDAVDEPQRADGDYEEAVFTLPDDYEQLVFSPRSNVKYYPKLRDDGWIEVELGEFYTENEDDCIEMSLKEVEDCVSQKQGLIVEGIEIRPRMG